MNSAADQGIPNSFRIKGCACTQHSLPHLCKPGHFLEAASMRGSHCRLRKPPLVPSVVPKGSRLPKPSAVIIVLSLALTKSHLPQGWGEAVRCFLKDRGHTQAHRTLFEHSSNNVAFSGKTSTGLGSCESCSFRAQAIRILTLDYGLRTPIRRRTICSSEVHNAETQQGEPSSSWSGPALKAERHLSRAWFARIILDS